MKSFQFTLMVAVLNTMVGCSPVLTPFTQKIYEEYSWDDKDLKRIQFYLSENIVLRRKFNEGESNIQDGIIKTIQGEKIEEIIFRKGTPCIYLFSPKSNRFAISFEFSDPPKYLMFGPNPKYGNRYMLLGKEWDRNSGTITYNGLNWYTTTESAISCLMVDLQKSNVSERNAQVVRGQRVQE